MNRFKRGFLYSRKLKRKEHRKHQGFELPLTSMMDVLVIILVFLLKSYQTSETSVEIVPGMDVPISTSTRNAMDELWIAVHPNGVSLEGKWIAMFEHNRDGSSSFKEADLDESEQRVVPLYSALVGARNRAEEIRAPKQLSIGIVADKKIPYDLLRKVLYTAGAARFTQFHFIAQRTE